MPIEKLKPESFIDEERLKSLQEIVPEAFADGKINWSTLKDALGGELEDDSPIEIRIFNSRIEILSYPGPLPPLNKSNLNNERVSARKYRNRRIGDFLKELHLTEGRGTGFPKIKKSLSDNGSPAPLFETDDDRTYFLTILYLHPQAQVETQVKVS